MSSSSRTIASSTPNRGLHAFLFDQHEKAALKADSAIWRLNWMTMRRTIAGRQPPRAAMHPVVSIKDQGPVYA
ncbi:MAG: hypothetical protein D6690_03850 [Nitrospirae bacterium]|nr:MAG: hypothetical protein D6690_03850 [Nitrospirota bacterium]